MKAGRLIAVVAMLPVTVNAQSYGNDWLFNDSTEFFQQPKAVIDTAKVESVSFTYTTMKKDSLNQQKDSIARVVDIIDIIINMTEKEKLQESNGTLPLYSLLLDELKNESPQLDKETINDRLATVLINDRREKVLQFQRLYKKEIDKADKLFSKKQQTHPVIIEYAKIVRSYYEVNIKSIEQEVAFYDSYDAFYWYRISEGNENYPQKTIYLTVKNANYRPALLQSAWKYASYDRIDTLELRLQRRGWEWMNKYDFGQQKEEHYPHEYRYVSFPEHPEYRLVNMTNRSDFALFDTSGNLVRFPSISHEDLLRRQRPNLIEALLLMDYRNDYANNKYNIKSEGKDVQYAIVNRLGISNESNKRMANAIAKGSEGGLIFRYSYNWKESIKGYIQRDNAARQMTGEMLRMMNDTAHNFLDQLKKDHEEDYKYIYKIERLTDVSFKVQFVTKELKPRCDVVITYYQVKPFLCDWQIDSIVKY